MVPSLGSQVSYFLITEPKPTRQKVNPLAYGKPRAKPDRAVRGSSKLMSVASYKSPYLYHTTSTSLFKRSTISPSWHAVASSMSFSLNYIDHMA
jgi:hypothetical protein